MRWLSISTVLLLGACAGSPDTPQPAQPSAEAPTADWAAAVEAEVSALKVAHPGAVVRIVVMDDAGETVLASHGEVTTASPTGSTMKPLTVFAALGHGLDPATMLDASAPVEVDGETIHDAGKGGMLSVSQAIAVSSNVAVVQVLRAVPWQKVYAEVATLVPLPEVAGMRMLDAVGQLDGFATAVPLQSLVSAYAGMAKDGERGAAVLDMLRLAVSDAGTGERARVQGLDVLGKTGTARNDGTTDAVFVGRASDGTTSVWIGVSVQDEGEDIYGGSVSAPAFAHIVEATLSLPEGTEL